MVRGGATGCGTRGGGREGEEDERKESLLGLGFGSTTEHGIVIGNKIKIHRQDDAYPLCYTCPLRAHCGRQRGYLTLSCSYSAVLPVRERFSDTRIRG
jgi:hypothetical protein